jgi:adenylyltransferase/sulfurtransferase
MFPEPPPPGLVPSCAEAGVLGVLPGTIGTMQATEGIKLMTGIGEPMIGRMLLYDALDMSFTTIKVRKNPNCPVCGIPAEQVELIDYEQFCGVPAHDHVETPVAEIPVPEITAAELAQRMNAGENLYVLDVRNPEEWEIAVIDGTVKIPKGQIEMAAYAVASGQQAREQTILAQIPTDREVIVHCRSGKRSMSVIETLREIGYDPRKLVNVSDGILGWAHNVDKTMPVY